jgi:hypothetical protein
MQFYFVGKNKAQLHFNHYIILPLLTREYIFLNIRRQFTVVSWASRGYKMICRVYILISIRDFTWITLFSRDHSYCRFQHKFIVMISVHVGWEETSGICNEIADGDLWEIGFCVSYKYLHSKGFHCRWLCYGKSGSIFKYESII